MVANFIEKIKAIGKYFLSEIQMQRVNMQKERSIAPE